MTTAMSEFVLFFRIKKTKKKMNGTNPSGKPAPIVRAKENASDSKSKLQNFYAMMNGEVIPERLKLINTILKSMYVLENVVDDLWKMCGGASNYVLQSEKITQEKLLKKRSLVVKEIFDTEEEYTKDITVLVNVNSS